MKWLQSAKLLPIALGLTCVSFAAWSEFSEQPLVKKFNERIDSIYYDFRLTNFTSKQKLKTDIVIIDIDDRALSEHGQWPWPRRTVAELVAKLWDAGVVVITFDVVFAEPQINMAEAVLHEMTEQGISITEAERAQDLLTSFDHDARLHHALNSGGDVVLGYILEPEEKSSKGVLPESHITASDVDLERTTLPHMRSYTANIDRIYQQSEANVAELSAGYFSFLPDSDGIVRRYPLLMRYQDKILTSLALETFRLRNLDDDYGIRTFEQNGVQKIDGIVVSNDVTIPTDERGSSLIPFKGPKGTFPYISAAQILAGKATGLLPNKIALIGSTSLGIMDVRATPVGSVYPGVEVHATMIDALLKERLKRAQEAAQGDAHKTLSTDMTPRAGIPYKPEFAQGANLVLILSFGLILAFILPYSGLFYLVLMCGLSGAAITSINFWYWQNQDVVLPITNPILMILLLGAVNISYGFIFEHTRRRQLKNIFGEYIPPQLVEQMSEDSKKLSFEGESRCMSVLFADIRGFTTLSETLDASDLKRLLNRFFTPMTKIIFEHRGTIDKYVGDMIMAFWNAPLDDPNHAQNGVDTALAMLEKMEELKVQFEKEGLPEVNIGIGINTGIMNVGDMGSEYRRSYTVIGDSVNLASRLEGLTKFYGVGLVISEYTLDQLQNYVCRKLDLVKVKGKTHGINVYCPICKLDQASPELLEELDQHHIALKHYLKQEWDPAEAILEKLHAEHPETLVYEMYLERIENLRQRQLPEDWDGVFERREK